MRNIYEFRDRSKGYIIESFPRDFAVIIKNEDIFVLSYDERGHFVCSHASSQKLVAAFEGLVELWKVHKTWTVEKMDEYYEKQKAFIHSVRTFQSEKYWLNNYYGDIHINVFIEELDGTSNGKFDFFQNFESEFYQMASCNQCDRYYHEANSSASNPEYYCSSYCEYKGSDDYDEDEDPYA